MTKLDQNKYQLEKVNYYNNLIFIYLSVFNICMFLVIKNF